MDKQIEDADALLQSKNVNIEAVNEHIHLREELRKDGLSTEDPTKLLNVLAGAKGLGFDAKKIVAKLSGLRPLEKREKQLRNNCTMFAKQVERYQEVLPLCQQIVSMRIGIDELIALKIAVSETAELYNLPIATAAFRVINDIKDYDKVIGLKKEVSRLGSQIYTMNEILGRKNNAVMALLNLENRGVTEDQIFNFCRLFEKDGGGMQSDFIGVQNAPDVSKQ